MKKVKDYEILSKFYSELMSDVDYKSWAEYLFEIYEDFGCNNSQILELGGGNGNLGSELNNLGFDVVLTDLSLPMIKQSRNIKKKVCCNMEKLPFKEQFDFIFSAFDSVNYLLSDDALSRLFNEVGAILNEDGIFTFDVSLEQNSMGIVDELNREGSFGDIVFIQKSKYLQDEKLHLNEFEIVHGGKKYYEIHRQRILPFNAYFIIIDQSPLYVAECFDAFTFNDASSNSERVQFVLKKGVINA